MENHQKIAIVTGTSRGLGRAISKRLVEEGILVYGLSRNLRGLSKVKSALGNNFTPVVLDISSADNVKKWVSTTFQEAHLPDILINNAGIGALGKIDELPESLWLQMVNTNLNGMYYLTSNVVPLMKKNHRTSNIINIGSILGTIGREKATAYATTKFGIQGFTDSLFKEVRGDNIKVTCLNPGSIESDFFKDSRIVTNSKMLQPMAIAETVLHILNTPESMLISSITIRPLTI